MVRKKASHKMGCLVLVGWLHLGVASSQAEPGVCKGFLINVWRVIYGDVRYLQTTDSQRFKIAFSGAGALKIISEIKGRHCGYLASDFGGLSKSHRFAHVLCDRIC